MDTLILGLILLLVGYYLGRIETNQKWIEKEKDKKNV
jgi:hypothetical protein